MNMYDVLNMRKVTRLCHFTKFQNLVHIINSPNGILATSFIDENKHVIDHTRADNQLDYVCCSIEYPNSWYLKKAIDRNEDIFNDWVVLYINPEIVNKRTIKVSECNAARNSGAFIKTGDYKSLEQLFDHKVASFEYPRTDKMLMSCPTNSQAEIMIWHDIPRDYISGIAVGNNNMAERVYGMLKVLSIKGIDIFISPDVISKKWRTLVQNGCRPLETRFIG